MKDNKYICSNLITKGTIINDGVSAPNYFCNFSNMNLNNINCGICTHFSHKPKEKEKEKPEEKFEEHYEEKQNDFFK